MFTGDYLSSRAYKLFGQFLAALPRPVQQNAWLLAPITVLCIARLIYLLTPLYISTPFFAMAVYWVHSKLSGDAGKDGRGADSGPSQSEEALLAEIAADEEKERALEQRRKSRQDSKRKAKAARKAMTSNDDEADDEDEDDSHLETLVSGGKK